MRCYYNHILIAIRTFFSVAPMSHDQWSTQRSAVLLQWTNKMHYILLVIALINMKLKNVISHMLWNPLNKVYNKNMNTEKKKHCNSKQRGISYCLSPWIWSH